MRSWLFVLLGGCAVAPRYVTETGGPCIEQVRYGKNTRYYRNGDPIGVAALEDFLAREPSERVAVSEMRHLRRAGWSLFALGAAMEAAAFGVLYGAGGVRSPPVWAEAVGGTLLASWFPTEAAGIGLVSVARGELSRAVSRANQRGPCP